MKICYCLSKYRNGKNFIFAQRLPGLALEIFQVTLIKPFTPQPLVLRFVYSWLSIGEHSSPYLVKYTSQGKNAILFSELVIVLT
jgi:hypothetical protein